MKKYLKAFAFFAAAALMAVSCSSKKDLDNLNPVLDSDIEQSIDDANLVPMEFSAIYGTGDADLKSTLGGLDGGKRVVLWQKGDQISVFDGTGNRKFTSRGDGESVSFYGEAAEASAYYALYPYQEGATISGTKITASVPQYQNLVPNSYGPEAALAVAAVKDGDEFTFKQATALLRITIPAGCTNIHHVNIYSNNGEAICGTIELNSTTGVATVKSGNSNIQMTHWWGAPESYNIPADYYVSIIPGTLANGLSVNVVYDDGDNITRTSSNSIKFEKGKIYNLGSLITEPFGASAQKTAVDLGLPSGTKWSSMNLGCNHASEFKGYFQFLVPVEVSTYNAYTIKSIYPDDIWHIQVYYRVSDVTNNYNYNGDGKGARLDINKGSGGAATWYTQAKVNQYNSGGNDKEYIHSVPANSAYDPAFSEYGSGWGPSWRSASEDDWKELVANCQKIWVSYNGNPGWLFIGANKNEIFIPAAGCKDANSSEDFSNKGYYWTSTIDFPASTPTIGTDYWKGKFPNIRDWSETKYLYQCCVDFDSSSIRIHNDKNYKSRGCGLTIRPVQK